MLAAVKAAVDNLAYLDFHPGSGVALTELIVETQRQIDRLNAYQATFIAEWNASKVWSDNGSRSAAARLERETGLSGPASARLINRAKRLTTMPLCTRAFLNGEISTSRVDLLTQANQKPLAADFARDEELLLDTVKSLSFSNGQKALQQWTEYANEANGVDKAQQQVNARSAHSSKTFQGNVDLKALFDPVSGEIFLNEHERLTTKLFEADWAEAKAIYGDQVTIDQLKRTPAQRRCDALVEMAKRSAAMKPGGVMARPLISIVMGNERFAKTCELASGTVINPRLVVPLLSDAQIERIVFDGPSRVLDIGHKRFFTGALRRVIQVRDGHCQHESGCDVPAKNCDVDHTLAFSKNGITVQSNGRLLCPAHNRAKGSGPP